MQRFPSRVVLSAVAAILLGGVLWAADDTPREQEKPKKIDWGGLKTMLEAGRYADAAAAADVIVGIVRPGRKAPDFLPRSVETIEALMRRGFAEIQVGKADAAAATFEDVATIFKDRDFQKLLANLERVSGPRGAGPLIELDLRAIELQNLRSAVALGRLRRIAPEQPSDGAAPPEPSPSLIEDIRKQVESIQVFLKTAADTRKKLADRFEKGGDAIVASPHKRALMSTFHPELIAGIAAIELSRLPFAMSPAEPAESPPKPGSAPSPLALDGLDRQQLLQKAFAHFETASAALDEAIKAALPKGVISGSPDKRMEVYVLLLQLSLSRCEAALRAGDTVRVRKELDEIFAVHKTMATTRKVSKSDVHPDMFLPLLFAAEVSVMEANALERAGKADEAREAAGLASDELARADAVPLTEEHPRREELSRIAMMLESQQVRAEASVATSDAAEVAARRVRRAIDGTAASTSGF